MKLFNRMLLAFGLLAMTAVQADNFAYVASGTNTKQPKPELSIVNTTTGKLVGTLVMPNEAGAVATLPNSKGNRVYVVASSQNGSTYIHTIDANLNEVTDTTIFSVYNPNDGSGIRIDTAALSPDDRWLFLATNPNTSTTAGASLYLVDLKNHGDRFPVFTIGGGSTAQAMAVSPDGHFVAIVRSNYWEGGPIVPSEQNKAQFVSVVTLLDLQRVTAIIDAAKAREPAELESGVAEDKTTLAFIKANAIAGDTVFTIPAPMDLTRENASAGLVFSPDPTDPDNKPLRLFVANSWADTVSMLQIGAADSQAWLADNPSYDPNIQALYNEFPSQYTLQQAAAPIPFPKDSAPYGLAMTPDNKTLYVTLSRRWDMEWNTSTIPFDGDIMLADVTDTLTPGAPKKLAGVYLWAPKYTSFHPRAISVLDAGLGNGAVNLVFIKQVVGSTTDDKSQEDGYYVSTVLARYDELRGQTSYAEVTPNVKVNSSQKAPIFFNGDFVGEDCESCPKGPEDDRRRRLNPPTAVDPWWLLLVGATLWATRRIYRIRH
ncbi:MAG: hypothetical protein OEW58_02140 [Gammaproteobacteria bacterium]|nr:hypothetical protein [Gammaproteobacteria bacterium]